jgi:hypothetical protein
VVYFANNALQLWAATIHDGHREVKYDYDVGLVQTLRPGNWSQLPADALAKVREENERLRTMSTVEMMGENANVDNHVREWEGRCLKAEARIEELERELSQAIARCGEWATKAGEAQGRLEASEMAGTVQGWKERATAAEAERDKLREALTKLTLKWRIDDFNGKNFPTKREAADEVEAALREPTDA